MTTKPRLYDEAFELLKEINRHRNDPVEPLKIANAIERRYRRIPAYELSDVYIALDALAEEGLVNRVEAGNYLGYSITDAGWEAEA